jgi:AcrR family transcriptional regulator
MATPTTAKPARVTKRRAETRARLLDAAFKVFADKGYGQVTIEDVCEAAGYSRGAFYSQFDSLEELFFILYGAWATQIAEQVSTAIESGDTITDLSSVVDRIVDTLLPERDWLVIKTDFLMYAARNPNLADRWSVHRAQLRAVIEESLGATSVELHWSIGTVTQAARAVISVYDGIGIQLLIEDDLEAARDWLRQLLNVVLERRAASG